MHDPRNAAAFSAAEDDVFARIAGRYDRLCDVFSLRIHRLWKSHMAARIADHAAGRILDVASGTGDIPLRVLRRLRHRTGEIEHLIVSDLCPEMLAIARDKLSGTAANLEFALLDAHDLADVPSGSIDVYSISFAMKICDRERVLAEAMRVLKPGGRFLCLEAARIPATPIHRAYLAYMDWCLPLIGRLAADGDASAYAYLLRGIHEVPSQDALAAELQDCGFSDVRYDNLTLGIVAMHVGRKP
ncbi:MAG: ubiquinone/menaquinone biosynthesis methyltransferase [Rhodospirillaceae bacterium]|nr:ubiquinone/menaquinone biosynthesis methyltransferase [Rhodospirillaceae bacterium]